MVESLLYVIEGDGRTIFYGTDTPPLSEDVWRGLRFDVAILDHIYDDAGDTDHLNAEQVIAHIARLRTSGFYWAAIMHFQRTDCGHIRTGPAP